MVTYRSVFSVVLLVVCSSFIFARAFALEEKKSYHFLYVSFHQGTRTNFDAIAAANNWRVTHVRPAAGYYMNRELAEDCWKCCYGPILDSDSTITHVLASDTIVSAGYPFLVQAKFLEERGITLVLHVTNYFDYLNEAKLDVIADIASLVHQPNVRAIVVDRFIELYMRAKGFKPPSDRVIYIPHSGRVVSGLRNPHIDVQISNLSIDIVDKPIYYTEGSPIISKNRIVTTDRLVCPGLHQGEIFALNRSHTTTYSTTSSTTDITTDTVGIQFDTVLGDVGIDIVHHQGFGGPLSLSNYDAIIYVPYHYSTMSVQEYLSLGMRVFVQSPSMLKSCAPWLLPELMDVYEGPLASLIEKYDSMEELLSLIVEVQEQSESARSRLKEDRREYMRLYDDAIFAQWRTFLSV